MTSHAYYKDRLGFDPNEGQYESLNTIRKDKNRQYYQQPQHRRQQQHSTTSPARVCIQPGVTSLDQYADTCPAKKAKSSPAVPHGGYEDALTQFKGTMSIWEYFVENLDNICKSSYRYFEEKGHFQTRSVFSVHYFFNLHINFVHVTQKLKRSNACRKCYL